MLENETEKNNLINNQNEARQENRVPVEPQINNPKPAHAYVPFQYMTEVYEPEQGLEKATIFPQLYMPYEPRPELPVMPIMPVAPKPISPEIDERS